MKHVDEQIPEGGRKTADSQRKENTPRISEVRMTFGGGKPMVFQAVEDGQDQKESAMNIKFDKNYMFGKIRELAKEQNVKIGFIERAAGFNPGYIARKEAEGNTSEPSITFAIAAAKLLGVSVDELLFKPDSDLLPSEEIVFELVEGLTEDTRTGQIEWARQKEEWLRDFDSHILNAETKLTDHPLLVCVNINGDECTEYRSAFYPKQDVKIKGDMYHAMLPGGAAAECIYIVKCEKVREEREYRTDTFYELYIVQNQLIREGYIVTPVCCSLEMRESLSIAIDRLYKEIAGTFTNFRLETHAKAVIGNYIRSRKQGS